MTCAWLCVCAYVTDCVYNVLKEMKLASKIQSASDERRRGNCKHCGMTQSATLIKWLCDRAPAEPEKGEDQMEEGVRTRQSIWGPELQQESSRGQGPRRLLGEGGTSGLEEQWGVGGLLGDRDPRGKAAISHRRCCTNVEVSGMILKRHDRHWLSVTEKRTVKKRVKTTWKKEEVRGEVSGGSGDSVGGQVGSWTAVAQAQDRRRGVQGHLGWRSHTAW